MAVRLRLVAPCFFGHVREDALVCSAVCLACCYVALVQLLCLSQSTSCRRRRRHLLGLGQLSRCILRFRVVGFVSLAMPFKAPLKKKGLGSWGRVLIM